MSATTVLIIEDEPQMRRFFRGSLPSGSHAIIEAATGEEGILMAKSHVPDLVLLDLGLPDIDGLEVTRRLREWTKVPIIVISARGQEQDKVAVLDAGADDYLTKPFSFPELEARIRVALRHVDQRGRKNVTGQFESGELRVDLFKRQVMFDGKEVRLTPIEYKLFATLVRGAGRVLTYQHLLGEVWGPRYIRQKQYLHVYMGHLRAKLERDPARPRHLLTEPGVGYRLKDES